MTIAVMQPYIFPYLGYYQLAKAVDTFVFFDDVNFINKGWINRNRILQQNEPFKFVVPLNKASQNRQINEIEISDYEKWKEGFIRLVENNYKKAPCFPFVSSWLKDFLSTKEYRLISDLAAESVTALAALFNLTTTFTFSSSLQYNDSTNSGGQDKIIRICHLLNAGKYVNLKNGMALYDEDLFHITNIELKFIIMDEVSYNQFSKDGFSPSLSILDVMMFNDINTVKELLNRYTLVNKQPIT